MLKRAACFLVCCSVAFSVSAQSGARLESYDALLAARRDAEGALHLFSVAQNRWRNNLTNLLLLDPSRVGENATLLNGAANRLVALTVPESLQSDFSAAVAATKSLEIPEGMIQAVDGLERRDGRVRPGLILAKERAESLSGVLEEHSIALRDLGYAMGRLDDVLRKIPETRSATDTCILARIDQSSRDLTALLSERTEASKKLSAALDASFEASALESLYPDYRRLFGIDSALRSRVAALTRIENVLTATADLSFRYWGVTPEGRFGEVGVALQIPPSVLLKGGEAVKSHINDTLPATVNPLATTYGVPWVAEGVDQDLPAVLASLHKDLSDVSSFKAGGGMPAGQELRPYLSEILARVLGTGSDYQTLEKTAVSAPPAGRTAGTLDQVEAFDFEKNFPKVDLSAPNYGVLQVSSGFDYRNIARQIAAMNADDVVKSCR